MILGLRDEEMFIFFMLVFGFVLIVVRMSLAAKERKDRLDLVQQALDRGLDEATRQQLLDAIAPRRRFSLGENPQSNNVLLRNPIFSLGWIGLFLGIGLIVIGDRDTFPAGVVIALISFGVVTMPFALRELESRRHA